MSQVELNNALSEAACVGAIDIVKLRVSQGADVNAGNRTGNTPLHWAAMFGKTDTVKYLLDSGADPDAKNEDGHTPCALAGSHGHESLARFLNSVQKQPQALNVREWMTVEQVRGIFPNKGVIAGNNIALAYMAQLVNTAFDAHLVANGVNAVLAETLESGVAGVGLYFSLKAIQTILTKADRPVPREIIDEVRATAECAVARKDGKLGIWLVHQPGQDAPVAMTESEFKAYEKQLADGNVALTKIAVGFTGKVTVTRTLGGKLHAEGMPALVVINPKNGAREEKWFNHGSKVPTPDAGLAFDEQNSQGLRV